MSSVKQKVFYPKYEGQVANGRMESLEENAKYTFPNGTIYIGTFKNGCFHGKGTLIFEDKGKYEGTWENGQLVSGDYTFQDGLKHSDTAEWYCTQKDRRYYKEHLEGIPPAGSSMIRSRPFEEDEVVPHGKYDCLNGFFDTETRKVHAYAVGDVAYIPSEWEAKNIQDRAYKVTRQESKEAE